MNAEPSPFFYHIYNVQGMGIGHVYATWKEKGKSTKGILGHSVGIELIGQNKPNID